MSLFEVNIVTVEAIEPIEGADKIVLARVGGYQTIIMKDSFKVGDMAFYIPEASIVPQEIVTYLGLEGRLAGSDKNRVKAIKLKGILSQGLLLPLDYLRKEEHGDKQLFFAEGDYAEKLGITKYEPVVPVSMSGDVVAIGPENTINFDIDNIKKYPSLFGEIVPVVITEKIHGTFVQIGILSKYTNEKLFGAKNNIFVASKGLGAKGLVFGADVDNIYTRCLKDLLPVLEEHFSGYEDDVYFLGEIFGKGVQDLHYGKPPSVRFFDVAYKSRGYLNNKEKGALLSILGFPQVPVLYQGRFSMKIVNNLLDMDTVEGDKVHMMEGVVIRADDERLKHPRLGRPILKAVSERYLLRKGGTEYN